MRVLLLNQFFPPDTAATGQLLADLAEELARRGHEVHVLCSRRAYAGGKGQFHSGQTRNGVRVHRAAATGFGRGGPGGRIIDYLSFYVLAARRAMSLPRMDACVSLTTPPFIALIAAMLKRRRGTRLILWTMDLYPQIAEALGVLRPGGRLGGLLRRISRRIYRAADLIVALGEVMAEKLQQAGADTRRIIVVHNWVPSEAVRPAEPPGDGYVTLLYSGNLGLGHELSTALEAVAAMKDRSKLRVRFAGFGRRRKHLQNLAGRLGLECVQFAPPCPLEQLSEHLARGDIHLVSQRRGTEGLLVPSKLYGILAAGRAVLYIGPAGTEVARIIADAGAGRAASPGDSAAAAEALQELTEQGDLRRTMGLRGREYYLSCFGRDRSVRRIAEAIESVVRKVGT